MQEGRNQTGDVQWRVEEEAVRELNKVEGTEVFGPKRKRKIMGVRRVDGWECVLRRAAGGPGVENDAVKEAEKRG